MPLLAINELSGAAKGCASGYISDPLVELAVLFVIQGRDQGIQHGASSQRGKIWPGCSFSSATGWTAIKLREFLGRTTVLA